MYIPNYLAWIKEDSQDIIKQEKIKKSLLDKIENTSDHPVELTNEENSFLEKEMVFCHDEEDNNLEMPHTEVFMKIINPISVQFKLPKINKEAVELIDNINYIVQNIIIESNSDKWDINPNVFISDGKNDPNGLITIAMKWTSDEDSIAFFFRILKHTVQVQMEFCNKTQFIIEANPSKEKFESIMLLTTLS